MPGIIRDNDGDIAGGMIGTPLQTFCKADGYNIAILGEHVASHGDHNDTSMVECSSLTKINGVGVCFAGNHASCGHSASPGSTIVFTV